MFCTQRKSQCRLVKQLIAPTNKGHSLKHEALKKDAGLSFIFSAGSVNMGNNATINDVIFE